MLSKSTFLLFLTFIFGLNVQAQVTGTVLDQGSQEPLIGAVVVVQGTSIGTATDMDGKYSIDAEIGQVLEFTYIGYSKVAKTIDAKTINVEMAQGEQLSAVKIVGLRGKPRTDVERPVPIDVLGVEELTGTGQTDLGQQLQYASPSFNSAKYGVNGTTNYADPASLRGMGPDQSLVLVNGKRKHQFSTLNLNVAPGLGNVVTDLNSLPSGAVKRMEVLRDGAAAQYGSDAIAGIINIALQDRSDGGTFTTTVGQHFSSPSDDASDGRSFNDGFTLKNSLNYGFDLGKEGSFVNFTLESFTFEGTNRSDYYSGTIYPTQEAFSDPEGPWIQDTSQPYPYQTENPREDRGVYPEGDFVVGNYGSNENVTRQFFVNASYPLNDKGLSVYGFGGYSDKHITAYGFFRNPGRYSRAVLSVFPDGYVPISPGTSTDYQYTGGINQTTQSGWDWDLSYSKGHNDLYLDIYNTTNPSFGAETETFFHVGTYNVEHDIINADFSKSLEVGNMDGFNLAMGAQYRTEKYWQTKGSYQSYAAGPLATIGKDVGASARPGIADDNEVDRNNLGFYVDVEADFTDRFLVASAVRFENYSDFGSNLSGKLAARYKLTETFSVRGSYNRGFRAPSVSQLGTINNTSTVQNGEIVITRQVPAADARLAELGIDNPQAEISNNFNLGLTSKLMDGALLLTVDAYQINIDDRIVITERLNTANFPSVAELFPDSREIRFFTNHANTSTMGLDVVASYKKALGVDKSLNISLAATFNRTEVTGQKETPAEILEGSTGQEDFVLLGQTAIELIEVAVPREKVMFNLQYNQPKWALTLRNTYFGSVQAFSRGLSENDPNVEVDENGRGVQTFDGKIVTDLAASWKASKSFTLTLGSNNILDVYPDKYNTTRNGFDGSASSYASGQIPYSRNSNQFGFNGRYVYLTGVINF